MLVPLAALLQLWLCVEPASASSPAGVLQSNVSDPAWRQAFRSRFAKSVRFWGDLDVDRRAFVASGLLTRVAKGCGFSSDDHKLLDSPDTYVFVGPVDASYAAVESQMETSFQHLPGKPTSDASQASITSDAFRQLTDRGYSVSVIPMANNKSANLVFLDRRNFDAANRDLLLDFGFFIGVAGPPAPGDDDGDLSYLYGADADLFPAGTGYDHLTRLCAATFFVKWMCETDPSGRLSASEVNGPLAAIHNQCDGTSPAVNLLQKMGTQLVPGQ